ncbi:MAG: T9SS type A sorting domain-containing protein [Saprospiraceae bacterium]
MKKQLLGLLFIGLSISTLQAQSIRATDLADCENVCEVEKTIQIDALLGVRIINTKEKGGADVIRILDHSAAKRNALHKGDIITAVDGVPVENVKHLVKTIQSHQPSDLVNIEYTRRDIQYSKDIVLGAKKTKVITEMICCDEARYFNNENISLFPNPTRDNINVAMEEAQEGKYVFQIFDINGKRVITEVNKYDSGFTTKIDITNIPTGEYFLRVSKGEDALTKAFVKQD